MKKPVIIIGLGEMGGVFAKGFLKCGYPVYPINRDIGIQLASTIYPEPDIVLLAVAEKDFQEAIHSIPKQWYSKLALLQNELLPESWTSLSIENPTVISVWFEKKKGQDVKILLPSPVYGRFSKAISNALSSQEIPVLSLKSSTELTQALVAKNLFVYTINITGLLVGGTTSELLDNHQELAKNIFDEIFCLQEALCKANLDRAKLFADFSAALLADPDHKCKGRSAHGRLERALEIAQTYSISTPSLKGIQSQLNN